MRSFDAIDALCSLTVVHSLSLYIVPSVIHFLLTRVLSQEKHTRGSIDNHP